MDLDKMVGELLDKYLELWLETRGEIMQERVGIDGYIAVVNFIEFVKGLGTVDAKLRKSCPILENKIKISV